MTIRVTPCDWDLQYVRCEHVAGDRQVDLVTYAPAPGRPAVAGPPPRGATSRSFVSKIAVGALLTLLAVWLSFMLVARVQHSLAFGQPVVLSQCLILGILGNAPLQLCLSVGVARDG